jgi:hypothetical protein
MNEGGMARLHSLLFKEGRELVNIKFFPGSDRGLTACQLGAAAHAALSAALTAASAGKLVDNPPFSGRPKTSLADATSAK